jgi:hypothetical protein
LFAATSLALCLPVHITCGTRRLITPSRGFTHRDVIGLEVDAELNNNHELVTLMTGKQRSFNLLSKAKPDGLHVAGMPL